MVKILISLIVLAGVSWGNVAAFIEKSTSPSVFYGIYKVVSNLITYKSRRVAQQIRVQLFSLKHGGGDVLVVFKGARLIYYVKNGKIVTGEKWGEFEFDFPVRIALGSRSWYWTPEGEYYITRKNLHSKYIKFLGISYPNVKDANAALLKGQITASQYAAIVKANKEKKPPPWYTPLGGRFGIHSAPSWMRYSLQAKEKKDPNLIWVTRRDFTWGCVGVEKRVVEYLFAEVREGTPILILP